MIITIIGGSGSGKSEFAEQISQNIGKKIVYLATMESESVSAKERILRHLELRKDKSFVTFEKKYDFHELDFCEYDTVLLECVSNLLANIMFEKNSKNTVNSLLNDIKSIKTKNIIFVTNNIFSDGIDIGDYHKFHGLVNQKIAEMSDEVYEVVCGIPIKLKGD